MSGEDSIGSLGNEKAIISGSIQEAVASGLFEALQRAREFRALQLTGGTGVRFLESVQIGAGTESPQEHSSSSSEVGRRFRGGLNLADVGYERLRWWMRGASSPRDHLMMLIGIDRLVGDEVAQERTFVGSVISDRAEVLQYGTSFLRALLQ